MKYLELNTLRLVIDGWQPAAKISNTPIPKAAMFAIALDERARQLFSAAWAVILSPTLGERRKVCYGTAVPGHYASKPSSRSRHSQPILHCTEYNIATNCQQPRWTGSSEIELTR